MATDGATCDAPVWQQMEPPVMPQCDIKLTILFAVLKQSGDTCGWQNVCHSLNPIYMWNIVKAQYL